MKRARERKGDFGLSQRLERIDVSFENKQMDTVRASFIGLPSPFLKKNQRERSRFDRKW
jgi:hypothetical protein